MRWTGGKQRLTATRLHELLVAEGHRVGVTVVKEAVAEWKRQRREVFVPLTYRPGDLAEVDFFEVLVDVDGTRRKAWLFLMRLMYPAASTAASADTASAALDDFARSSWGTKFPTVVASWRRAWTHVIPFFAFPPEVRRVIYTTNALESVHAQLRKIIKTRGHFPTDEAATKLIWLALRNITAKWDRGPIHWKMAMNQFAILYEDRFTTPNA